MNILEKWGARGLAADEVERMVREEYKRLDRLDALSTGRKAYYSYERARIYAQARANVEQFLIENQ